MDMVHNDQHAVHMAMVVVAPTKSEEKDMQPVVSDDASTASPNDDDVQSESSIPS